MDRVVRIVWSSSSAILRPRALLAHWMRERSTHARNWGDALNPKLINRVSGRPVLNRNSVKIRTQSPTYFVIGSILQQMCVENAVIWGAGVISQDASLKTRPRAVHAVRGPLTRRWLNRHGVDCPTIYGDPALLYPRLFAVKPGSRIRLGLIPHYSDQGEAIVTSLASQDGVQFVDILGGIERVANQVASCDAVVSSSLHGLVLADALGVPSLWVEFGGRLKGGHFKFCDYLMSVERRERLPMPISRRATASDLIAAIPDFKSKVAVDALLEVCPFRQ